MKVLIIKLSAFGDIIHALPALDDILARDDVDEVHWLVDQRFAFVTQVFPEQVHIHQVNMKSKQRLRSILHTLKQLRKQRFDVIIDLQGLIKSSLMARLTGARVFGFDRAEIREKPAAWLENCVPFHRDDRNVVQKCRRVATGPWLPGKELQSTPGQAIPYCPPTIHRQLPDKPLPAQIEAITKPWVILHVGGSWITKQLPDHTWQAIARGVEQRGAHAIICWGNNEELQKAQRIAKHTHATPLPERLDILTLCSLLRRSVTLITTDTGILHLGSALRTPTISFWGVTPSWRNGAFAEHDIQIESNPACGPCVKRSCANFICMDMIRADDILAKVDEHLSMQARGDNCG